MLLDFLESLPYYYPYYCYGTEELADHSYTVFDVLKSPGTYMESLHGLVEERIYAVGKLSPEDEALISIKALVRHQKMGEKFIYDISDVLQTLKTNPGNACPRLESRQEPVVQTARTLRNREEEKCLCAE